MHQNAFRLMAKILGNINPSQGSIVYDIGSMNVNGTLRPLIDMLRCKYVGVDQCAGKNVDVVVAEENWSLPPADMAISANALEHCKNPFVFFKNVFSVLRPGGLFIVVTPLNREIHRFPIDCWRILPDGMVALCEATGFDVIEAGVYKIDTYYVCRRPACASDQSTHPC